MSEEIVTTPLIGVEGAGGRMACSKCKGDVACFYNRRQLPTEDRKTIVEVIVFCYLCSKCGVCALDCMDFDGTLPQISPKPFAWNRILGQDAYECRGCNLHLPGSVIRDFRLESPALDRLKCPRCGECEVKGKEVRGE